MPWLRPTLEQLVDRARADLKSRLAISGAIVRRSTANIVATVWAGSVHVLHGYLEWLATQMFADTADAEFLLRRAAIYGLAPIPASAAKGELLLTGVNGTNIPGGTTIFVRDDNATFVVDADAVIAGGVATVNVTATVAGAAGNTESGAQLTVQAPIAGLDPTGTVGPSGLEGGADQESIEALRTRLLTRLRKPPTGGNDADYIEWAKSVAGVTRVWVSRHENGLGTVVVRFVRDGDVPIFPGAGAVADVQAVIDSERPTAAEVTVAAPVSLVVPFTLAITPDTTDNRDRITASLDDLFFRKGDASGATTITLNEMITAIGVVVSTFTLTIPGGDIVPLLGELATRGTITWA